MENYFNILDKGHLVVCLCFIFNVDNQVNFFYHFIEGKGKVREEKNKEISPSFLRYIRWINTKKKNHKVLQTYFDK